MKEIVKTQRTVIQNIPQEDFQNEEDEILRFAAQQISTNIFPNEVGIEERRTFARVSEGEDLHVYMKDNIITLAEGVDIILGEDVADEDIEIMDVWLNHTIDEEYADEYAVLVHGEQIIHDYLKPLIKFTPIEIDGKPFVRLEANIPEYSFKK